LIKQFKRNNLESSDWPPSTRNEKSIVAEQGVVQAKSGSLKRPGLRSIMG